MGALQLTDCTSVHSAPTPILDDRKRVIGICAGHPDDPTWDDVQRGAASELNDAVPFHQVPSTTAGDHSQHWRGVLRLVVGSSYVSRYIG